MVSAVAPLSRRSAASVDHDAGIFVQPRAMKGRLNEPALAACSAPSLVSRPIAEEPTRTAQRSPFDEPMLVRHQHLLDVVGMIQQEHVEAGRA